MAEGKGNLIGLWVGDLQKWMELDPQIGQLGDLWSMLMREFKVEVTDSSFTVSGQGKENPKTYEYKISEADGSTYKMDIVFRGKEGKAEAVLSDQGLVIHLLQPKAMILAVVKRP